MIEYSVILTVSRIFVIWTKNKFLKKVFMTVTTITYTLIVVKKQDSNEVYKKPRRSFKKDRSFLKRKNN